MKYSHVIWDFDGTLFDSYPVMAGVLCAALAERGIKECASAAMALMKQSMGRAESYYRAKYGLDGAFSARFNELKPSAERTGFKPYDGACELCRDICIAGGKNYMFTHRGGSTQYFMEKFGLSGYFIEIVTSEHGFGRKPAPDALLYLMKKHGFSGAQAVMVGDRDIDMLSAANAGVHTCFFAEGGGYSEAAEATADSFDGLRRILGIVRK